jgi:hypothetical protein
MMRQWIFDGLLNVRYALNCSAYYIGLDDLM